MLTSKKYIGLLITSLVFFGIFIIGMIAINQINTKNFDASQYLNRFIDLKQTIMDYQSPEAEIVGTQTQVTSQKQTNEELEAQLNADLSGELNEGLEEELNEVAQDSLTDELINEITESDIENTKKASNPIDESHYNDVLAQLGLIKNGQHPRLGSSVTELPSITSVFENTEILLSKLGAALTNHDKNAASLAIENIISDIEAQTAKKSKLTFALIAIIASVGLFLIIAILIQVIRLNQTDSTTKVVSQESQGIMSTVSEGLFLLDSESNIGIEQSTSLKKMFDREDDLEGNFFEFIGEYVSPKDVDIAKDFIKILFAKKKVKESLIRDLNPLNQVQVHISRRDGSYEIRYLNFTFNRVYKDKELEHLLVSTSDITKEVTLAAELEQAKEKNEAQIDLMMSILKVDSSALAHFFETASTSLTQVNEILKERGHNSQQVRRKVDEIFRLVHNVKGDSASLNLHAFEGSVHIIEEELVKLRENPNVTGKDLLKLTTFLKDSFLELEKMSGIIEKVGNLNTSSSNSNDAHNDKIVIAEKPTEKKLNISAINSLHQQVSKREAKINSLYLAGMDDSHIPEALHEVVQKLSVQLIRNAIVHGIETTEQRKQAGKQGEAKIVCRFSQSPKGHYIFSIQDNGAGIDADMITQKALSKGFLTEEQIATTNTPQDILNILCTPGYSSKDEADLNAGRGVGLDIVQSLVKEYKGKIQLSYKKGQFCRFAIAFPPGIKPAVSFDSQIL